MVPHCRVVRGEAAAAGVREEGCQRLLHSGVQVPQGQQLVQGVALRRRIHVGGRKGGVGRRPHGRQRFAVVAWQGGCRWLRAGHGTPLQLSCRALTALEDGPEVPLLRIPCQAVCGGGVGDVHGSRQSTRRLTCRSSPHHGQTPSQQASCAQGRRHAQQLGSEGGGPLVHRHQHLACPRQHGALIPWPHPHQGLASGVVRVMVVPKCAVGLGPRTL